MLNKKINKKKNVYEVPITYTVTKTVKVKAGSYDEAEDIVSDNLDKYISEDDILQGGDIDIGTNGLW